MDVDPPTSIPEVKGPGIFFLSSWRLDEFRNKVLSTLRHPIVLITHHGDVNIKADFWDIAESSFILRWFAQNQIVEHSKVEPIPIGLEDQRLHSAGHVKDFVRLRNPASERKPRIVWGFSMRTNPDERFPCYKSLWKNPIADELWWPMNARLYRKEVRKYMFVASPPGNGFDCHRTWEALYLGVVPIVLDRYPYKEFIEDGLPMYPIQEWSELRTLDETRLREYYETCKPKLRSPLLSFQYWHAKIQIALRNASS
jgi:hypothetical protein